MKRLIVAVALLGAMPVALAQAPFDYPATVGTTQVQILPVNNARKKIWLHNPNATAILAFCPAKRRDTGGNLACAINGAGSITLAPLGAAIIEGSTPGGAPLFMPGAWNVISDTGGSNATALEWE